LHLGYSSMNNYDQSYPWVRHFELHAVNLEYLLRGLLEIFCHSGIFVDTKMAKNLQEAP
jgi:hypothetical protein